MILDRLPSMLGADSFFRDEENRYNIDMKCLSHDRLRECCMFMLLPMKRSVNCWLNNADDAHLSARCVN